MKRLLVLGLDPGTTVGYALLDHTGKILICDQEKHMSLGDILSRCVEQGKVLLVGTDKAKVPETVRTVATKLGAEIISPKSDLLTNEKKTKTEKRAHARDALAGARLAHDWLQPLLKRCAKKKISGDTLKHVLVLVIKHHFSIDAAHALVTQTPEEPVVHAVENQQPISPDTIRKWANRFARQVADARKKNKYIQSLNKQIASLREENRHLYTLQEKERTPKRIQQLHKHINRNTEIIEQQKISITELKKKLEQYTQYLFLTYHYNVLPRVTSLSHNEVMDITHPTWVYVDNPNEFSPSVRENTTIQGIICAQQPSSKVTSLLPFPCVTASRVTCIIEPSFVLVEKRSLSRVQHSRDTIHSIIEQYQRKRKN